MRAIKEARKLIEKTPESDAAKILSQLVLALEAEGDFHIADIYQLNYHHFKLALADAPPPVPAPKKQKKPAKKSSDKQ